MNRVAIVDHGLCNIDSIRRALEECGGAPLVTDDPADLEDVDRIVLPGVGAFGDAMANLRERKLDVAIVNNVLDQGVPFLGICLGMQLLATTGRESGDVAGLGLVAGEVVRLEPTDSDQRVPHVGWNEVHGRDGQLLHGVDDDADFYFVHSYHLRCDDDAAVAATTPYCGGFTSVVEQGNVFATQFHPEKSQRHGFEVLRNFLAVRAC
jgi:glutamine amidotransferase